MMLPGAVWLRWVRARLAARPDTEHEQAIVRVVVGVVLFFYLLPGAMNESAGVLDTGRIYLAVMFAFLAFAVVLFAGVLLEPGVSVTRRLVSAAVDVSAVTFFMAQSGVHGVPMFLIYVWVTLANGFRYGQRYLLFALALSVAGFGVVLMADDFWRAHLTAGLGLAIVRDIAAGHGASLALGDGANGHGCRVAITFPHG